MIKNQAKSHSFLGDSGISFFGGGFWREGDSGDFFGARFGRNLGKKIFWDFKKREEDLGREIFFGGFGGLE